MLNCEWALCFVKTLHHALLHLPHGLELQEVRRGGLTMGVGDAANGFLKPGRELTSIPTFIKGTL